MLAAAVNFDDDHENWEAPRTTARVASQPLLNSIAPAAANAVGNRLAHTYVRPFIRCAAVKDG